MNRLVFCFVTLCLVALSFSACSAKGEKVTDDYYDRANKASEKAHNKLNKD